LLLGNQEPDKDLESLLGDFCSFVAMWDSAAGTGLVI
jgi:hypothetical protein